MDRGLAARDRADFGGSEEAFRAAYEINIRVRGTEHPSTLVSLGNLAFDIYNQGRYAEAERLDRRWYEASVRVLGPTHPDTLNALDHLASSVSRQKRYAEAE